MLNEVYFSIIVPVYRVEQFLPQCVESILKQVFTNFELILIDDGSADNCSILCDGYAKKDSRVKVIHKDNGGPASARNIGMKNAQGEYICFVDSDDFWKTEKALMYIFDALKDSTYDIAVLKYVKFYENTNTFGPICDSFCVSDFSSQKYSVRLNELVAKQLYDACAWNKVFRRELMDRSDLFFEEGIIAEDLDWAARLALVAESVTIVEQPVYAYRKGRAGSLTTSLKLKNLIDTKSSIERCLNYTAIRNKDEQFERAYYNYVAYRYVIWMAECAAVNDKKKQPLVLEMKKYDWLLNHDANRKVFFVNKVYKIFGFKLTSLFLKFYLKKKKV